LMGNKAGALPEREWPSPAGPSGLVKAGKTDAKSTAKIGTSSSRSENASSAWMPGKYRTIVVFKSGRPAFDSPESNGGVA
jgi:hypothetical protein